MEQRSEFNALMRNSGLDLLKEYDANEDGNLLDEAPDYDAINLSRYKRAMKDGSLGSIGPVGPGGTGFSPNRWDKYADMANQKARADLDEPLNYDDIGMEDPDEVYRDVNKGIRARADLDQPKAKPEAPKEKYIAPRMDPTKRPSTKLQQFNSKENDADVMNEMDRMLKIAGLR